jgi:hypothetical protein
MPTITINGEINAVETRFTQDAMRLWVWTQYGARAISMAIKSFKEAITLQSSFQDGAMIQFTVRYDFDRGEYIAQSFRSLSSEEIALLSDVR